MKRQRQAVPEGCQSHLSGDWAFYENIYFRFTEAEAANVHMKDELIIFPLWLWRKKQKKINTIFNG